MKDKPLKPFNIPLDGKLMTGVEPGLVGKNFRKLQNMRYVEHGLNPQGIPGMKRIGKVEYEAEVCISTEFPVGRCYGWDALLAEPYAFTYDIDYNNFLKIDLNTLQAVDYLAIDEGTWKYQVIDICSLYAYLVFYGTLNLFKVIKISLETMEVVASFEQVSVALCGADVMGGAADYGTLYLTSSYDANMLIFLPTDLSMMTITEVIGINGAINGMRGLKIDPSVDLLYGIGSGGMKSFELDDFELVAVCNSEYDTWPFVPGSQTWEGGLMMPYFNIWTIGYHPWTPRAEIGCGPGTSYPNGLRWNPVSWTDWCSASVYSMGFDFFGGTSSSATCSIEKIKAGGDNLYYAITYPFASPVDTMGYEVACNRTTSEPVTKSITAPVANPTEIGTWLTKFDSDCGLLEWREKIVGWKTVCTT